MTCDIHTILNNNILYTQQKGFISPDYYAGMKYLQLRDRSSISDSRSRGHTSAGTHELPVQWVKGAILTSRAAGGVTLNTHVHLTARLRLSEDTPPYALMACTRTTSPLLYPPLLLVLVGLILCLLR